MPQNSGGMEKIVKKLIILLAVLILAVSGCTATPGTQQEPNGNETAQGGTQEPRDVGSAAESKADKGIQVTVTDSATLQNATLKQTASTYFYKGNTICSVKTENTYTSEENAESAAEQLKEEMEGTAIELSVDGDKVTYYASQTAVDLVKDMTPEEIKEIAKALSAEYKEIK